MRDILSMSLLEIESLLFEMGEQKFRAKQIFQWLHVKKVRGFAEMSNLSLTLREKLTENFYINILKIKKKLVSAKDNTAKYLYILEDGEKIETVFMEYRDWNSLCVSTQVGCKMKCAFCASGVSGFARNLSPSEMLAQIYETERDNGEIINNLVLMGIGEPLDNFDNVVRFLRILSDKNGRNMSLRHVSLSTCGLAEKIRELADMKLNVTLSVSLHAADDLTRSRLMPVNNHYNISEVINACEYYFKKSGRRISFEFALISGVNDDEKTMLNLVKLLKNLNAHVNVIPVNSVKESEYKCGESVARFCERLNALGLNATVRRTLGADIEAACGQLRRDNIAV